MLEKKKERHAFVQNDKLCRFGDERMDKDSATFAVSFEKLEAIEQINGCGIIFEGEGK